MNDQLFQLFQHTLHPRPDIRIQAELELKKASVLPGFLAAIFQLVSSPQTDLAVRQAGNFKIIIFLN